MSSLFFLTDQAYLRSLLILKVVILKNFTKTLENDILHKGQFNNYVTLKLPFLILLTWTFEYNSKFKYKHSNLRLKHYLHYKVRWKRTNKPIKHATLDFAFHICNLFFNYTKILHWIFFTVTSRTLIKYQPPLIYHHGESRKMCRET